MHLGRQQGSHVVPSIYTGWLCMLVYGQFLLPMCTPHVIQTQYLYLCLCVCASVCVHTSMCMHMCLYWCVGDGVWVMVCGCVLVCRCGYVHCVVVCWCMYGVSAGEGVWV